MVFIGDSGRFELKVDGEHEGADAEDKKMDGSPICTQPQQKENERSLSEKEFQKNMIVKRSLKLENGWSFKNEIKSNLNSGGRCRLKWTVIEN